MNQHIVFEFKGEVCSKKIFFGRLMSAEDIIVLETLKIFKGESCVKITVVEAVIWNNCSQ